MNNDNFIRIFKDTRFAWNKLSQSEKGDLLDALFNYYCDDLIPKFSDRALDIMFWSITSSEQRYIQKKEDDKLRQQKSRNKQNMSHDVTTSHNMSQHVTIKNVTSENITESQNMSHDVTNTNTNTNTSTDTNTNTSTNTLDSTPATTEVVTSSNKEKTKSKTFSKPTLEEVAAYMEQYKTQKGIISIKSTAQQSEAFWDYYNSNGWRVGRGPMKDWEASARRWIQNENQYSYGQGSSRKLINTNADGSPTDMTPGYVRPLESERWTIIG